MRTVFDPAALQAEALERKGAGQSIGFVPTMGYLHQGHLSLMALARSRCDWLVVSIFVNPRQFGPNEDLDRYPRDPDGDHAKCEAALADVLFMPPALYDADHSTSVEVSGLTRGLCGSSRPAHFEGVTTVVARLFGIVQPTIAVFGEKDFQQLAVIRRMVRDLAMGIEVVGGPLIRDTDGLALSSRNRNLTNEQRARALSLHKCLNTIADSQGTVEQRLNLGRATLDVDRVDYLEIVDPETLEPLTNIDRPARALVAAWLGKTRLIDNLAIPCP